MSVKNFVGIYEDAFSKEFCERTISGFEELIDAGFGWNRQDFNDAPKTKKDDHSFYTGGFFEDKLIDSDAEIDLLGFGGDLGKNFSDVFWNKCYKEYAEEFSILDDSGNHSIYGNKIQKTKVGGGYHVWHYEAMNRESANRLLTYIVYLNDVEEGGETELLYYPMRVKPKAGTCIIFPAAFTHTHWGNPPISNEKYILTGWVEF